MDIHRLWIVIVYCVTERMLIDFMALLCSQISGNKQVHFSSEVRANVNQQSVYSVKSKWVKMLRTVFSRTFPQAFRISACQHSTIPAPNVLPDVHYNKVTTKFWANMLKITFMFVVHIIIHMFIKCLQTYHYAKAPWHLWSSNCSAVVMAIAFNVKGILQQVMNLACFQTPPPSRKHSCFILSFS